MRRNPPTVWEPQDDALLIELRQQGKTLKQITEHMGRPDCVVRYRLRSMGLTKPHPVKPSVTQNRHQPVRSDLSPREPHPAGDAAEQSVRQLLMDLVSDESDRSYLMDVLGIRVEVAA